MKKILLLIFVISFCACECEEESVEPTTSLEDIHVPTTIGALYSALDIINADSVTYTLFQSNGDTIVLAPNESRLFQLYDCYVWEIYRISEDTTEYMGVIDHSCSEENRPKGNGGGALSAQDLDFHY